MNLYVLHCNVSKWNFDSYINMALSIRKIAFWNTFLNLINLKNIPMVSGERTYCEFGLCTVGEYCCGYNNCCVETLDTWYFWSGVLLVIIAIAVGCGVRYCYGYNNTLRSLSPTIIIDNRSYKLLTENDLEAAKN